ncbi:MAG: NADH-quinone oxidoreductase subunit NuoF [Pedobacter sp.]
MSEKKQLRIATRNSGFIDPEKIEDYIAVGGYQAIGRCLVDMTPQQVVDEMTRSGLRGRGGAGFPTGVKWGFAAKYQSDTKYIICNADEGDPGAYMDRAVLEGDPHTVIEGMIIAGYAIGARHGAVYIRAEYPLAIKRLRTAIEQAEEYGLLGEKILGSDFSFDIELKYGAGAFVCGEETALIRSIEGNRGEPYTKPPFPAESGYWNKPTIVNNVETLANVPAILMKGPEWFSSIGSATAKGTKVFSLVGKITNVGLIEVPMGITLKEVIFDIGGGCPGGKEFKAVQTGGPSGGVLTYKDLDIPIDYESLAACESIMGSGGMIVMDEDACMVAIAKFFLEFTMEESCGKCTPCRIGSKRLWELLENITIGQATEDDLEKLVTLARTIKDTALCGLGQTMPNPILSTVRVFRDEYLAHIRDKRCPAGVCKHLLQYVILKDKCVGCTLCAKICPVKCISGAVKELHVIDQSECIKCGACLEKCKFDAIVTR